MEVRYERETKEEAVLAKAKDVIIGRINVRDLTQESGLYEGWWILNTWVNPWYRRLGIGQGLTQKACEIAFEARARQVRLLVFEDNIPARRLYGKMGFLQISIPSIDKELAGEAAKTGRRRIVMTKDL